MDNYEIIKLDASNVDEHGCYCLKNKKLQDYKNKVGWMKKRFAEGLSVKIAYSQELGQLGFIEYVSGENCWRGFNDSEYMFIHCIYIAKKDHRQKNLGKVLIEECQKEAQAAGKKGMAVISSSSKAMLAEKNIFEKYGFQSVDSDPSGYELLIHQFKEGETPQMIRNAVPESMNEGLHLLYAYQCPFFEKSKEGIANVAKELNIPFKTIQLESAQEAQQAPSIYGIYNLIHNGELIAEHYISEKRFSNIMKKRH